MSTITKIAIVFVVPGHCASIIDSQKHRRTLCSSELISYNWSRDRATLQLLLLLVPIGQYNSIVLEVYVHCVPYSCDW